MKDKIINELKSWNWSLLVIVICIGQMGALQNESFNTIPQAIMMGLILSLIMGLPLTILTKEPK